MKSSPESFRWHMGEALIQRGWLDWSQLDQAKTIHQKSGLFLGGPSTGARLTSERAYRALASQYQLPFVDLNYFTIQAEAIQSIPTGFIFQYKVIPIVKNYQRLIVAISHPRDRLLIALLKYITKVDDIRMVIACPKGVEKAIDNYYGSYQVAA